MTDSQPSHASEAAQPDGSARADTNDQFGLQSSTRDRDELRSSLETWLSAAGLGDRITSLEVPEHTGVSSLSVMVEVEGGCSEAPRHLVARLAPDTSAVPVFPTYDLEKQFLVLDHLAGQPGVRVPAVHRLELDPAPLGVPFFVMDHIEGRIPPDILPYPFGSWVTEADRADQRRLQDGALAALAAVHAVELPDDLEARLAPTESGPTALHRHVAKVRSYYEWCSADGVRSSVIEEGFSWLDDHWPEHVDDQVLSWGDARIGNMVFQDFTPAALLDWEMVSLAPREVDLGWMIYLHRWFDDIAAMMEIEPMRHFMRVPDAVATYEAASGAGVRNLRWFLFYAALHHGIVMFRVSRRQIAFGQTVMPDDPNDLILHRPSLEQMMEGSYWPGFEV